MGLDPTKAATGTMADMNIDPVRIQNREGMKHERISNIPAGVMLAQIVVTAGREMTPEEFWELREIVRGKYDVLEVQMVFAGPTPQFDGHRLDLYLSSHIRAVPLPVEETAFEVVVEGENSENLLEPLESLESEPTA